MATAGTGYRWPAPAPPAEQIQAAYRSPVRSRSQLAVPYVPAQTEAESAIADVCRAALRTDQIGIYDNLFALGGDSLTAVAICSQLRIAHGIIITADTVLDHPTVAGIARQLTRGRSSPRHIGLGLLPVGGQEASHGQRRIWAAEMIDGCGNAQVIPLAYKIRGPVDTGRLETALRRAIDRHPSLRTNLVMRDRVLMQQVTAVQFRLRTADIADLSEEDRASAADALAVQLYTEPFTAGSGVMLRALAIRLSALETLLIVLIHHSAADGWSVGVLQRDISALYRGAGPPDALGRPTFADYTRLSQAREQQGDFAVGLAAVKSLLRPFRTRPRYQDLTVASSDHHAEPRHTSFPLSHAVLTRTRKLAQDCSTTPFAVFLAAFQLLVGIADGSDTAVIGCPAANRADGRFDETVGFFANLVPVPARFRWDASLSSHLRSASAGAFESLRYADVPYGLLTSELNADLSVAAGPPFEAVFTLQPPPSHPLTLTGCEVSRADPAVWPLPFPLMLDVEEHGDEGRGLLRYDAAAALPAAPEWFAAAYPLALTAFWALPHRPLRFLRKLLCPAEGAAEARQRAQQARHRGLRALRNEGNTDDGRS